MKLEHLIAVGVRLFAISLIIFILQNIATIITFYLDSDFVLENIEYYIGLIILSPLLVLWLWFFPLKIASKISGFPAIDPEQLENIQYKKLLETGIILIGIYCLYFAIVDLFYWMFFWFLLPSDYSYADKVLTFDQKANTITTVLELVFAVYLILGNKGIAKIIRKLRQY